LKEDEEDEDRDEAMDMDEDNDGPGSPTHSPDDHPDTESANGTDARLTQDAPNKGSLTRDALRDLKVKDKQKKAKEKAKIDLLLAPARGHPPSIYYLPAILLPSQRRFLEKRKAAVSSLF